MVGESDWDTESLLADILPAQQFASVHHMCKIQTALSRLIQNKTVLVIAHRMRTVAGANQIIVLEGGTVAEEGTPGELMNRNGLFARMSALQTESDEWAIS